MTTYAEFQQLESSEKIALVKMEASRRIMGWVVHAGSVYKSTGFFHVLVEVLQDGTTLTDAGSLGTISAGKYYNDRNANILYLQTTDSTNPNSKFIAITFDNYFSTAGNTQLANDLASGFEVDWLPILKSTSKFGVALDNKEFLGFALEGSGALTFLNDRDYWDDKYDKWYWDNQRVFVYSWNRELAASEAQLIFRGLTQSRSWAEDAINFRLKDTLKELRQPMPLDDLSEVSGAIVSPQSENQKQRVLYGRLRGHVPSDIDQTLPDGNLITGTASTVNSSPTVTGSGTLFLKEVSPDDVLIFGTDTVEYSVDSIASNTSLTLTEDYGGSTAGGKDITIKPSHAKKYQNRVHLVAGHALKVPATTVSAANRVDVFEVADDTDFFVDAEITVGSEVTRIQRVSSNVIEVLPSLSSVPAVSTAVTLSAIWDVFLNEKRLFITRDYTFDASTAKITLDELAEFNIAPSLNVIGTVTFNSTRAVTGSGTFFTEEFEPGDWIRAKSLSGWFEILSIQSDTAMTLRIAASYSTSDAALKRDPLVYKAGETTLSLSAMGATENGTTTGDFIGTGALAVQDILTRVGLSADIVGSTFDTASSVTPQIINLAIPDLVTATKSRPIREVISKVNQSIFGSLYQNDDFKFEYKVIEPNRTTAFTKFIEPDVLGFSIVSDTSRIVKDVVVEYLIKEYDPESGSAAFITETQSSETAEYLAKTNNEFRVATVLQFQADAKVFAQRWAFIRELVSSVVKFNSSLQAALLHVHDRIKLAHSKLYDRYGAVGDKVKLAGISAISRDLASSSVEIDDVGNSFNRTAAITANDADVFDDSTDNELLLNGFITDNFGLINNDEDTYQINSIW